MFVLDAIPGAEVKFLQYNTSEYDALEASPGMLFCDFSPPALRVQEFVDAGAIVLDHHKFAKPVVDAFGELGVFGDEVADPGVCGAYLAYREVWSVLCDGQDVEEDQRSFAEKIARLIGVRDTWQRLSPDWNEACALSEAIKFYPTESWLAIGMPFHLSNFDLWKERQATGQMLIEKTQKSVRSTVDKAFRFTSEKGLRVVLFPRVKLSSDAAEFLHEDADLVVGFDYFGVEDGLASLVFSTRSHTTFDCGAFCKHYSGGGHTKAAGFTVKFDPEQGTEDPFSLFRRLLSQYETHQKVYAIHLIDDEFQLQLRLKGTVQPPIVKHASLETARETIVILSVTPENRATVRIGPECLGKDAEGVVEVWV